MDCIVHEVAKNWTQLRDFHFQAPDVFPSVNLTDKTVAAAYSSHWPGTRALNKLQVLTWEHYENHETFPIKKKRHTFHTSGCNFIDFKILPSTAVQTHPKIRGSQGSHIWWWGAGRLYFTQWGKPRSTKQEARKQSTLPRACFALPQHLLGK